MRCCFCYTSRRHGVGLIERTATCRLHQLIISSLLSTGSMVCPLLCCVQALKTIHSVWSLSPKEERMFDVDVSWTCRWQVSMTDAGLDHMRLHVTQSLFREVVYLQVTLVFRVTQSQASISQDKNDLDDETSRCFKPVLTLDSFLTSVSKQNPTNPRPRPWHTDAKFTKETRWHQVCSACGGRST